jgi:hypothetical protein
MNLILAYIARVGIGADMFINVLTGGQPDQTVSYRCAVAARAGRPWDSRTLRRRAPSRLRSNRGVHAGCQVLPGYCQEGLHNRRDMSGKADRPTLNDQRKDMGA